MPRLLHDAGGAAVGIQAQQAMKAGVETVRRVADDGDGGGGVGAGVIGQCFRKGMAFRSPGLVHDLLAGARISTSAGCGLADAAKRGQPKQDLLRLAPQGQGKIAAVGGKAGEDGKGRPPPPDLWSSSSPADRRGGFSDLRPLTSDLWHLDVFEQHRGPVQGVGDGGQFQFGADRFVDGFEPALLGGCGDEFVEVHGVCFRCDALRKCVAPGMGICQYIRSGFRENNQVAASSD